MLIHLNPARKLWSQTDIQHISDSHSSIPSRASLQQTNTSAGIMENLPKFPRGYRQCSTHFDRLPAEILERIAWHAGSPVFNKISPTVGSKMGHMMDYQYDMLLLAFCDWEHAIKTHADGRSMMLDLSLLPLRTCIAKELATGMSVKHRDTLRQHVRQIVATERLLRAVAKVAANDMLRRWMNYYFTEEELSIPHREEFLQLQTGYWEFRRKQTMMSTDKVHTLVVGRPYKVSVHCNPNGRLDPRSHAPNRCARLHEHKHGWKVFTLPRPLKIDQERMKATNEQLRTHLLKRRAESIERIMAGTKRKRMDV